MARNETGRMIRVRPETYERVTRAMTRLTVAVADGILKQWWEGDDLTADQFVRKLIERHERHIERAKLARKRKRAKRAAADLEDTFVPTNHVHQGDGKYMMHPLSPDNQKGRVSHGQ